MDHQLNRMWAVGRGKTRKRLKWLSTHTHPRTQSCVWLDDQFLSERHCPAHRLSWGIWSLKQSTLVSPGGLGWSGRADVWVQEAFPCGSAGKVSACHAGDLGLIPGLGRSAGKGKDYPLQYSGLENSMDSMVHGVAKSQTQLNNFHFHFLFTFKPSLYRKELWVLTSTASEKILRKLV